MLARAEMSRRRATERTLARLGLSDLRPVYQPVVDLRDGRVVGYEALVRGGPDLAARVARRAVRRSRAPRTWWRSSTPPAARPPCAASSSTAPSPFTLFLNAAADTLGDAAEIVAPARHTIVIEITERALISQPGRAAARAHPVPRPGLGRRARERRRRLALAGADVAALSRRDQARPAPPPAALAGGHRADRRRGRRGERAPPGGRARRGHRLRGADGGRARVRRPARAGLPARRAGAAARRPCPSRAARCG